MRRARDERGLAMVEAPLCIAVVLLLLMGVLTITQIVWTHMDLAEAARDTARYATRTEFDRDTTTLSSRRHRTAEEVKAWAALVAEEAGLTLSDVTITTPDDRPLESLIPGDQVTVTLKKKVANPLYTTAAGITNAMAALFPGRRPFDPTGVTITAEAETYVE